MGANSQNMPSILVNTHAFHYEETGRHGAPLVFLSGLGGDHRAFGLAQRHFGPRYRTLAFDARDVGRSDRFSDSYTTADMADDVAGWLETIAAPGAHVVGHSLGGPIRILTPGKVAEIFHSDWTVHDQRLAALLRELFK